MDRKDAKFLAYTLAGNVDFLIAGDRDFTDVETLGNTQIVSVSGFVESKNQKQRRSKTLIIFSEAEEDIALGFDRYSEQQERLGEKFL